jgi:hypothetical protein
MMTGDNSGLSKSMIVVMMNVPSSLSNVELTGILSGMLAPTNPFTWFV